MKSCRGIIIFAGLASGLWLWSGCFPVPDHFSGIGAVYPRVGQNNVTNAAIIMVRSGSGWVIPLTPDGGRSLGYTDKTSYFYVDRHYRGKSLRFLDTPGTSQWELFVPVQATNQWVRVQGYTNSLAITVFTPHQMLNRHSITTRDIPSANYVHLLDGNRTLNYKSDNDEFIYNVPERSLDKRRQNDDTR